MDKSKRKIFYWGVTRNKQILFEGSFSECWKFMVDEFGSFTVGDLSKVGIKIERIR